MNVLELYSGIGGMHMALKESGIQGIVVAAADINTTANTVYTHNFPETKLLNRNIQNLTPKFINSLNIDTILMSPPCQPFTRNGLKGDNLDPRTCSFTHLLNILSEINVKYILIENVKGFETSVMHERLIEALKNNDFTYQEFLLSPTQFGVSNTRCRYYCLAKKKPLEFSFEVGPLMEVYPDEIKNSELFKISDILEKNINTKEYLLPDNILKKHARLIDICTPDSKRSCCFTKAYSRYIEGTGSIFTSKSQVEINETFQQISTLSEDEHLSRLKQLELRFFTPTEVSRLMSFPDYFSFPKSLSNVQKYRLLGNSINVKVVSELVSLLFKHV